MALNKPQLKTSIYNAFYNRLTAYGVAPNGQQLSELLTLADEIGEAVDTFVKQAQVNYTGGLTATADGDPVVGAIKHTIS